MPGGMRMLVFVLHHRACSGVVFEFIAFVVLGR